MKINLEKPINKCLRSALLLSLFIVFGLSFKSCSAREESLRAKSSSDDSTKTQIVSTASGHRVSFMAFNVENLFDAVHDEGKNDLTYLPLYQKQNPAHKTHCSKIKVPKWRAECLELDWSEKNLAEKMRRLAKVIKSVNEGRGPDVLFLQEVENIRVLHRLIEEYLPNLSYSPYLIEGNDLRGIDVAIVSRLPIKGSPQLYQIPFSPKAGERSQDTRGILEVSFELPDSTVLWAYSVHFPAPFHPTWMRKEALAHLNKITQDKEGLLVVGGDFNITSKEQRRHKLLDKYAHPRWRVSHLEGCKDCRGSTYYPRDKTWSFLDMIWISQSQNKKSNWILDSDSISIPTNIDFQKSKSAPHGPASFKILGAGGYEGVSDHWPVYLEIYRN